MPFYRAIFYSDADHLYAKKQGSILVLDGISSSFHSAPPLECVAERPPRAAEKETRSIHSKTLVPFGKTKQGSLQVFEKTMRHHNGIATICAALAMKM